MRDRDRYRGRQRETKRSQATERKTNHAGKLVYNNCNLQVNILTKYQQIEQQNTNKILTNRQQEKAPCSQHKYYISQIHKAIYIKVQQIFSRAPPGIVSFFLALTDIWCLWGIWKTDNNKEQRAQSRGRRSGRRSGNILYFKQSNFEAIYVQKMLKKNKAKADFIIEAAPAPSLPWHLVFLPHVLHMQMRQQQQHELSTLRSTGNNPPEWPQGN